MADILGDQQHPAPFFNHEVPVWHTSEQRALRVGNSHEAMAFGYSASNSIQHKCWHATYRCGTCIWTSNGGGSYAADQGRCDALRD